LNRTLPEDLRFINVFQYDSDWVKCIEYVTNVIPQILLSNFKEFNHIKENGNKNIFFSVINTTKDQEIFKNF